MAYTRTWDSSYEQIPNGGDLRKDVDDRIRDFKKDVRERMDTITNWTFSGPASDIAIRPQFSGVTTDKVLMVPAHSFIYSASIFTTRGEYQLNDGGLSVEGTGATSVVLVAPIILPATAHLTNLKAMFYNSTSASKNCTAQIFHTKLGVTGENAEGSATFISLIPVGGTVSVTNAALLLDLVADRFYWIKVIMEVNGAQSRTPTFYGVKITYDVPTALALR